MFLRELFESMVVGADDCLFAPSFCGLASCPLVAGSCEDTLMGGVKLVVSASALNEGCPLTNVSPVEGFV